MVIVPAPTERLRPAGSAVLPQGLHDALAAWIAGVLVVSLVALLQGAPGRTVAVAAALGLAPAVANLLLAPHWAIAWTRAVSLDSWSMAAALAVALTGGSASPCTAAFAIAPAWAHSIGDRRLAGEQAAVSVVAYAAATLLARFGGVGFVAPASGSFTVLSLAFAGWLLVRGATPAALPTVQPVDQAPAAPLQSFANAAHELRTPLNHILGFGELIQREMFGPLPAKYRDYVDLIVASARRMQRLATRWLDLARLDAGHVEIAPETIDVAALVRDAVSEAEGVAAQQSQTIAVSGADTPHAMQADPDALREIVDNLIGNALKFTPAGGRVQVRLIGGSHAVIIDVEDNGPGISEADKARLGKPFERGSGAAAFEGAGLGLTLAKALLAAHRGRLDVLDAESGGALMRIVLPVSQG